MQPVPFREELDDDELRLSSAARQELRRIFSECDDPEVLGIRLFVAGRGCSGMTYALTFADRRNAHDRVAHQEGFSIFVDAIACAYLQGAEIDYQRRPGNDAFVFNGVFQATAGSGACGGCAAASE